MSEEDKKQLAKTLAFPLGELFTIGPDQKVGKIKEVYFSRSQLVQPFPMERGSLVVRARGLKLGTLTVTLVGEKGEISKPYIIRIVPDIAFIRELMKRQFPRATLKLTPAGDNLLLVEGAVDAPGDVDAIIKFLEGFIEKTGKILNGIQVVGVQQVQLEVCIAQVDRTALRNMGANYLQSNASGFFGNQIGSVIGAPSINVAGNGAMDGSRVFTNFNSTPNGMTNTVLGSTPTFFFGLTKVGSAFFGFLQMLRQEQLIKILATPTLVTLNGRAADFLVGGEQPYSTVVGSGLGAVPNVDFKPFGTRLTFLPVILGDGKVRLDVIPEVSRPVANTFVLSVPGASAVPAFETQRLHATVEMENGQTLAMGGLLQSVENVVVTKVPVLGDIPGLGCLFRTLSHQREELELLILVTPHLVDPLQSCQRPTCLPGQETRPPTDCELYLKGMPEAPFAPTPLEKIRLNQMQGGPGPGGPGGPEPIGSRPLEPGHDWPGQPPFQTPGTLSPPARSPEELPVPRQLPPTEQPTTYLRPASEKRGPILPPPPELIWAPPGTGGT